MDNRRLWVQRVLDGMSLSQACRLAGVTRKTARKWATRVREAGLDALSELSRAPKSTPGKTDSRIEELLVELRLANPVWGARKLVPLLKRLHGVELPVRTAEHILRRAGLTKPQPASRPVQPFERETFGELLQMDFKGLPRSTPYAILSVLDDHGRYCFKFEPVPDKTAGSVQTVLWDLFGVHGLPKEMLMDNGDCWGSFSRFPTRFEAWLLKLGVKPIHGRPRHPQTQGKVERFHGTAQAELGASLIQPTIEDARRVCREFVDRYNWVRPHDSLGARTPGSVYRPFEKKRPDKLPEHHIPQGAISRKVDVSGWISYRGKPYKIGKGLIGERIVLQEEDLGTRIYFAEVPLPFLHEL